jgi:hypothetical protein
MLSGVVSLPGMIVVPFNYRIRWSEENEDTGNLYHLASEPNKKVDGLLILSTLFVCLFSYEDIGTKPSLVSLNIGKADIGS